MHYRSYAMLRMLHVRYGMHAAGGWLCREIGRVVAPQGLLLLHLSNQLIRLLCSFLNNACLPRCNCRPACLPGRGLAAPADSGRRHA
jgi:hypothetical protein